MKRISFALALAVGVVASASAFATDNPVAVSFYDDAKIICPSGANGTIELTFTNKFTDGSHINKADFVYRGKTIIRFSWHVRLPSGKSNNVSFDRGAIGTAKLFLMLGDSLLNDVCLLPEAERKDALNAWVIKRRARGSQE